MNNLGTMPQKELDRLDTLLDKEIRAAQSLHFRVRKEKKRRAKEQNKQQKELKHGDMATDLSVTKSSAGTPVVSYTKTRHMPLHMATTEPQTSMIGA